MTSFSIACTTCHARLKVRDHSLVGQIIACPKCGSMVLVAAPSAATPAQTEAHPSEVVRPDSSARSNLPSPALPGPGSTPFDADFDSVAPVPAPHESRSAAPSRTAPAFSVSLASTDSLVPSVSAATPLPTELADQRSASGSQMAGGTSPQTASPQTASPETTTSETPTSAALEPSLASRGSLLVWIVGGTLGGIVLAMSCFLAIAYWGAKNSTPPPMAQASVSPGSPSPITSTSPATGENGAATPPGSAASADQTGVVNNTASKPNASVPPPANSTSNRVDQPNLPPVAEKPAVQPNPQDSPNQEMAETLGSEAPAAAAKPERIAGERPGIEPEGPPGLKPIEPTARAAGPAPVAGRFANLLAGDLSTGNEGAGNAGAGNEGGAGGEPSDLPAGPLPGDKPGSSREAEEIVRPRLREIDVAARLADPLTKMRLKDLPLADFANLMSDLSTIPVSLDVDALRTRWISASSPVSVETEQTTVRGVLSAAVEPLQLGIVVGAGQVQISHLESSESAKRRRTHDVADLVGADAQQLEVLAQWVQDLVEPDTWIEAGGAGTIKAERSSLVIENKDSVHFQTLYLCDKLRAARKLPPRGKYAASLLAPASLPARAESALRTPITLNFSRATRLTQILNRLGQAANVRLVIDWQALQDAGWTPDTMAKLNTEGRELSESLRRLLEPRELTFRVIDDVTLEVTTPAAVARKLEWEIYPVSEFIADGGEARGLMERLQEAVGANHFRVLGGSGSVRYVAASRSLLIAAPEPQQRVAARWLEEQRSSK